MVEVREGAGSTGGRDGDFGRDSSGRRVDFFGKTSCTNWIGFGYLRQADLIGRSDGSRFWPPVSLKRRIPRLGRLSDRLSFRASPRSGSVLYVRTSIWTNLYLIGLARRTRGSRRSLRYGLSVERFRVERDEGGMTEENIERGDLGRGREYDTWPVQLLYV